MIDVKNLINNNDLDHVDKKIHPDIEAVKKSITVREVMTPDCLTANPNDDLMQIAQAMMSQGVTCVVGIENQKAVGMLTQMDLVHHLATCKEKLSGTLVDCMSNPVISVYPEQSIWDATELLEEHRIKRLPVLEEGILVGIITQTDLIRAVYACGSYKEVNAILKPHVGTLTPDKSVEECISMMSKKNLSCLVICEDDKPVGIVSERDILERIIAAQKDIKSLRIKDIMTSPLIMIDSRYSIHSAACLMDQKHIHRLVIHDGGKLKGVITRTDIFKAALQNMEIEKAMAAAYQEIKKVESQLIQNEKLASIGQMAAGVAHEMNTPVGFVSGNFQSLKKYINIFMQIIQLYEQLGAAVNNSDTTKCLELYHEIESSRQQTKFDFIMQDIEQLFSDSEEGIERISAIVQNLRDFSRIDQMAQLSEYDMNQGIESSLMVARNAIKYDADVVLDLGDVPIIQGNGGQINQVILNICVNAAQAIQSQNRNDRGTIKLKTYLDNHYVVCEIKDDGPGIAPEHLRNIFDPFFTTKPVGKGTGLGLSVSYDIITNKHNGQLLVQTEVGEGTTFMIKLPLEQPASETPQHAIIAP